MKVYLDSSVVLAAILDRGSTGRRARDIINDERLTLVGSSVVEAEVLPEFIRIGRPDCADLA